MTFGIPIDDFPISSSGELKIDRHKEFLEMLRRRESKHISMMVAGEERKPIINIPSRSDVLFGRGKPFQQHPGNLRLNMLVESMAEEYDSKRMRKEKTAFADEVAEEMKRTGVRFLHKVDGIWEEADESMIRDKVSNTFRSVRAVMQKEGRIVSLVKERKSKAVLARPDDGTKKRSRQN
jgi:hypothetical protein